MLARATLARAAACAAARAPCAATRARTATRGSAGGAGARPAGGKPVRRRLDDACARRFPEHSKSALQSFIAQGKVFVGGKPVTKAGTKVLDAADDDPGAQGVDDIVLTAEVPRYVSRAGLKLEAALEAFAPLRDAVGAGAVVLDAGLSTGGFADCLRQHGASKVYGVDVGYGQVAEKVRVDDGVVVMERTNLRYLMDGVGEPCDIATLDLSFIGVRKCMPAVCAALREPTHTRTRGGKGVHSEEDPCEDGVEEEPGCGDASAPQLAVLIKPQFEAGRQRLGKGGVVRDEATRQAIMREVTDDVCAFGFELRGVIDSPVAGRKEGNVEFLGHFVRTGAPTAGALEEIAAAVEAAEVNRALEEAKAAGQRGQPRLSRRGSRR